MTTLGYDHQLFILAFDHRGSFVKKFFGVSGDPDPETTNRIVDAKRVIYEGALAAVSNGIHGAGVLVDEQFGTEVARQAHDHEDVMLAMPVERSGQDEFDFEFGAEGFTSHIDAFDPDFSKVLVRYNPEGDGALNARQAARLATLSQWLHAHDRRFLFELLVPSEPHQLEIVDGDADRYDVEVRPRLMHSAIAQLQEAGIEADIWKIEGLDRREDCDRIVSAARRAGRDKVGCIILGRGENDSKVQEWLRIAAGVPGLLGFAVGRTTFWDPLVDWLAGKTTREDAVLEIGRRYRQCVEIFERRRETVAA